MSETIKKTALNSWHHQNGGQMVDFAGWDMPVSYKPGILEEHLATRKFCGMFDVSHMGRFLIRGKDGIPFLQKVLTNNALALDPGMAQYTMISNERGGAIDDAYLYRLNDDPCGCSVFLLVVNASNREKDWDWFQMTKKDFSFLSLSDVSEEIGMIALQGPRGKEVLDAYIRDGRQSLPDPWRNRLCQCLFEEVEVTTSRTGYTGEPICFELFVPIENLTRVWEKILELGRPMGLIPVGLGARDTLRLEAGLPLYGHELGNDPEGKEIPIYSVSIANFAVSLSPVKGDFIGKSALARQFEEVKLRVQKRPLPEMGSRALPRRVVPITVTGSGIVRQGAEVHQNGSRIGYITSGTMVPYWSFDTGVLSKPSDEKNKRAIALAYVNSEIDKDQKVEVIQRGKPIEAIVTDRHLSGMAPPYARPVHYDQGQKPVGTASENFSGSAEKLVDLLVKNTNWRQLESINLIPSENTPSPLVRLLTISDPEGRYAEHKLIKALGNEDVFFYQGTKVIEEVENLLADEFRAYFGCSEVETKIISGQMANAAVFSGLVDYLNRMDRKRESRRLRKVMNHHLGRGGHLSSQPMGALKDFVAHDPITERAAAVNFPVLKENLYQIDIEQTREYIEFHRPELIVLGKSMILHKEPVDEIVAIVSGMNPKPIVHYDMAHVLGLYGPDFQEPLKQGVDFVTGSTHKTFFGPQRGVIASNMSEGSELEDLWKSIVKRVFPGSVSNHHLGTQVGLLMACYEMNAFRSEYQKAVISNAKVFAAALNRAGIQVEGDARIGYTETHQVIVRIGYGRGPAMAEQLEENNIIVNYQAAPDDEGFTAASCLRLGTQEMTRFGMGPKDFEELAEIMSQVILHGKSVTEEVSAFRKRFTEMSFCLPIEKASPLIQKIVEVVSR